MQSIRDLVRSNMSILEPTVRTLSAIGALTMLGASIGAIANPIGMSSNMGLPLASPSEPDSTSPSHKSTDDKQPPPSSSQNQPKIANRHSLGFMYVFAGRNSVLALSMLTLNYMGELRALSVMGQFMTIGGLADSLATYWYGVPGSYKGHLIPTLAMIWMGPLGLLMYY